MDKSPKQINDIQKERLTLSKYESIVLHAQCNSNDSTSNHSISLKKDGTVADDEGNTFEIVVISEDFDQKIAVDNEFEEFELLEVDHMDTSTDIQDGNSVSIENSPQPEEMQTIDIPETVNVQNEITKSPEIIQRRKQKPNIQIEIKSVRKSARQAARTQKPVQTYNKINSKKLKTYVKKNRAERASIRRNKEICEIEILQEDYDDVAEGESDDEFPARDSDNDEWPSQETLDDFPKQIIKDGLLMYKGKELMSMICR